MEPFYVLEVIEPDLLIWIWPECDVLPRRA